MVIPENQGADVYRSLVKEAYIDPIRAAVLIDDDFPTLEEYLSGQTNKDSNTSVLVDLIKTCRATHWLVDVHNGKISPSLADKDTDRYRHLHHSDLMILDYHLDGDDSNDKAMQILRSLAKNNYFNMVVVYTKGTSAELQARVLEIARGLTYKQYGNGVPESVQTIVDWEDEETDIVETLKAQLSEESFLRLKQESDIGKLNWKKWPDLQVLKDLFNDRSKNKKSKIDSNEVLNWLVKEKYHISEKFFSSLNFGKVDFAVHPIGGNVNWIRTDNLFVTVVAKSSAASEIPNMLLASLEASEPSPYRLLMSKMRNCLDESGVGAEAAIVRKGNIQAGLLWQMLHANPRELSWKLRETIGMHWEQLASAVELDIHKYGTRLFESVLKNHEQDKSKGVEKYTAVDLMTKEGKDATTDQLNSFICSKKASGVHLMPGQIFCITDETGDKNYWICLSPACDLVPAQKEGGKWIEQNIVPFTVVKLWPVLKMPVANKINTNEYLFIEIDGKISRFGYTSGPTANPVWEQFFATENGAISEDKINFFSINKYDVEKSTLVSKLHCAELVAQLRYEYALNLMNKLGADLTRVGLNFFSIADKKEQ